MGRYPPTNKTATLSKSAPPSDPLSYDTATGAGLPTFKREKAIIVVEWSYTLDANYGDAPATATITVEAYDGVGWNTLVSEGVSATPSRPSDSKMDSGKADIEAQPDVALNTLQVRVSASTSATGSSDATASVDIDDWRVTSRRNRSQVVGPW